MDSLKKYPNISTYWTKPYHQEMEWFYFSIIVKIHSEKPRIYNQFLGILFLLKQFILFPFKLLMGASTYDASSVTLTFQPQRCEK